MRSLVTLVVCWVTLAGCGGGDGGSSPPPQGPTNPPVVPPPPPPPPVIGADGGTVTDGSGASITFPAGAVADDTTFRIAVDSTGAPPLPESLIGAGSTYVITPHGGDFQLPVEVSIPVPNVTLLPDQQLKLAKAEPNGQWQILDDATIVNGKLTTTVRSFSFFTSVIVTYQLPILQLEPFRFAVSLTCDQDDCQNLVGPARLTYTVSNNGGQLPQGCTNPTVYTDTRADTGTANGQYVPLSGFTITRTVEPQQHGYYQFQSFLFCDEGFLGASVFHHVSWSIGPAYPAISVMHVPARLDVVEGLPAHVDVMLGGGALPRDPSGGLPRPPTSTDHAIIDWQRSDDGGSSWRNIARSFQNEADPLPYGTGMPWRPWGVRHGFIATIADQGAMIRVRACYAPPAPTEVAPCATSTAIHINVLQSSASPAIVNGPRSILIRTGETASFSATASGLPPPTLQWQTRPANSTGEWTNVSEGTGATSTNYTTSPRMPSHNGEQYRVVATNAAGSAASVPVILSVSDIDVAPSITTQPASLSVVDGNDAVFAVVAHGTEALSYQWRFNGTNIAGANSPVLRLDGVTFADAGAYSVAVSNTAGSATSNPAILTVTDGIPAPIAPSIVTQPSDVSVNAGNTATLAVGVAGTGPFTFQWMRDGSPVSGATSAVLTFNSVALPNAGSYSVRVTNGAGEVVSNSVFLDVVANDVPVAPTITSQPASLILPLNGSGIIAVGATGTGPLSYQWLEDNFPIPGATDAVLHFTNVNSSNFGTYTVTVSNSVGSVTSQVAELIQLGAPEITQQPASLTVNENDPATFSVQASGSGLRYQWLLNGTQIPGATDATYETPPVVEANGGAIYSVMVYNAAGMVTSEGAVLTVQTLFAPTVWSQPADVTLEVGDPFEVCAAFMGTRPITVHHQFRANASESWTTLGTTQLFEDWQCRWTNPMTMENDGNQYRFIAENALGQVTTDAMTISVILAGVKATTLVSVELDGGEPDYSSGMPSLSTDGRQVAFTSYGLNLVAGVTTSGSESGHAYLRDVPTGTTTLINRTTTNGVSSRGVVSLKLSGNGRYALFTSFANDLVPGDTNDSLDVFRRDLQTGITQRVNVLPSGNQIEGAGNGSFDARLAISGDGRYVAFASDRDVTTDGRSNNGLFLYVRDMLTGTTRYVGGTPETSPVGYVAMSENGRYLAFTTNVVAPADQTIWYYDIELDTVSAAYTYPQSPSPAGQRPGLSISADGRYIAFAVNSEALTGSTFDQIVMVDRENPNLSIVSAGQNGTGNGHSSWPQISGDGRHVIFESQAPNLTMGLGLPWRRYAVVHSYVHLYTGLASRALDNTPLELSQTGTLAMSGNGNVLAYAAGQQVYASPSP